MLSTPVKMNRGDHIKSFCCPAPKNPFRVQYWSDGVVLDVEGPFIRIKARIAWGGVHTQWFEISKMSRIETEENKK